MPLAGHLWTVIEYSRRAGRHIELPPAIPWSTEIDDPTAGSVTLTGRLRPQGDDLLLIVHGLGGCVDSGYVAPAEAAALESGLATLAINVRGADRRGDDFPHAALTADLAAALASPEVAGYSRVLLLGYSLGGHLVLRHATEDLDPRVRAVAAVSPPLDLAACGDYIDRPAAIVYRRYLLARLLEIYASVAERHPSSDDPVVPISVDAARRIRSQREFDHRIVAARHGFDGVEDYYRRASVGPILDRLGVPSLLVAASKDPMVPGASLVPFLETPPERLTVRWVRGGHVAFPARLDLGEPAPLGLEPQVLSWLLSRASEPRHAVETEC